MVIRNGSKGPSNSSYTLSNFNSRLTPSSTNDVEESNGNPEHCNDECTEEFTHNGASIWNYKVLIPPEQYLSQSELAKMTSLQVQNFPFHLEWERQAKLDDVKTKIRIRSKSNYGRLPTLNEYYADCIKFVWDKTHKQIISDDKYVGLYYDVEDNFQLILSYALLNNSKTLEKQLCHLEKGIQKLENFLLTELGRSPQFTHWYIGHREWYGRQKVILKWLGYNTDFSQSAENFEEQNAKTAKGEDSTLQSVLEWLEKLEMTVETKNVVE